MCKRLALFSILLLAATMAVAADTALAPTASIAEIHSTIITPSSDALFQAESSPPVAGNDWASIARSASSLAKAASELMSKSRARDTKQWMTLARALRDESNRAAHAAKGHNIDALIEANGRIVAVCEACHDDYRDHGRGMTSDQKTTSKP